jgi:hypothetical protein
MPRNKGHRKWAIQRQRNAGGKFESSIVTLNAEPSNDCEQQIEKGDEIEEGFDEIYQIDCREHGWHSEQDDNGSESDDCSCDEFDEETINSEENDFPDDAEFGGAMPTDLSASDEEHSDLEHQNSTTQQLSDPSKFLSWTRDADKGPIANKMPRGSSRSTIWHVNLVLLLWTSLILATVEKM